MKEIRIIVMGNGTATHHVSDTANWGQVKQDLNLDTSMEYRIRGEVVSDSYVPFEYDTFIATRNVKGGI